MNIFKQLTESGLYILPYLMHIYDEQSHIYLINNTNDVEYKGITYKAAAFNYNPAANGSATFEAEILKTTTLGNFIKRAKQFNCELIGVYIEGEIISLSTYRHNYGEATWDEDKFQISLESDARESMTFPALIYNTYNNRGA